MPRTQEQILQDAIYSIQITIATGNLTDKDRLYTRCAETYPTLPQDVLQNEIDRDLRLYEDGTLFSIAMLYLDPNNTDEIRGMLYSNYLKRVPTTTCEKIIEGNNLKVVDGRVIPKHMHKNDKTENFPTLQEFKREPLTQIALIAYEAVHENKEH